MGCEPDGDLSLSLSVPPPASSTVSLAGMNSDWLIPRKHRAGHVALLLLVGTRALLGTRRQESALLG